MRDVELYKTILGLTPPWTERVTSGLRPVPSMAPGEI